MERRLCYCKSCASFFIISPEKSCPKCHGQLISSVITEEEWNKSNTEQKDAFKKSLASMSNKSVYRQNEHTAQSARKAQDGSTVQKEKGHDKSVKPERKHVLGKILIALAIGFVVFQLFKPYDGACTDYASAGKKVYKQIAKDSPKAYVSYHTDHYNPLLGTTDEIRSIMNEAYKNNGDPQMGDHLFMRTSWSEEYTAIKQKDGTYNLNITVHMFYNTTTEQEKALKEKADAILTRLDLDGASDYEKVRAIYNYICSNVTYDYDHRGDSSYRLQYTAYAAAINRTAVCAGVADLFYYLATAAGLEARITVSSTHAWNIVKVDGRYYYLDPTWDLGENESDYQYFLRGSRDFVNIEDEHDFASHSTIFFSTHPLYDIKDKYEISDYAYGR